MTLNNPSPGIKSKSGSYTGDGTGKAIAHGCGVVPTFLVLYSSSTNDAYIQAPGLAPTKWTTMAAVVTQTATDATNFNVTAANGNVNLFTYVWIAFYQ